MMMLSHAPTNNPLWAKFAENRAKMRAAEQEERDRLPDGQRTVDFGQSGSLRVNEEDADEIAGTGAQRGTAAGSTVTSRASGAATATTLTSMDVLAAKQQAQTAERERIAQVFASPHSRGRERIGAFLLTHEQNFSTKAIVDTLAEAKTDAQTPHLQSKAEQTATDAMWDKAHAKLQAAQPGAQTAAPAANSTDAAWDRARAEAQGRTAAEAVWDRANAKIEAQRNLHVAKPSAPAAGSTSAIDAAWDRARAEAQPSTTADPWEKANARIEAQRRLVAGGR